MNPNNARSATLQSLLLVQRQGQRLEEALDQTLQMVADKRDQALARELSYGVMRWKIRLDAILELLLQKPLKSKDMDVNLCLLLGLYQILYTRIPEHAAVRESVELLSWRKKQWAKSLVNGVLRRFLRERDALTQRADQQLQIRLAHPQWLFDAFHNAWPGEYEQILNANNVHPPMSLRVNQQQLDRESYRNMLQAAGHACENTTYSPDGLRLVQPTDVGRLPGFSKGLVSVQDEAAQLAAGILDLKPGLRVLDACAAPGGKTAHILETEPGLKTLLALESDPQRLSRLAAGLERLQLNAELLCTDARHTDQWWRGERFDRILLDAPCSATGIIRRHPDIRHRRTAQHLRLHTELQMELLQALWPTLAPEGKLLYATCSIMPEENQLLIDAFLTARDDAIALPLSGDWGREVTPGRQILPGDGNMDGFYYALLGKRP